MGKIIDFPAKKAKQGLYERYYMTAEGSERFYIRETAALNLTNGYDAGYSGIQKILCEEDLKRLLGACAAWWKDKKCEAARLAYLNELFEVRCRLRGIKRAKTN